MFIRYRLKQSTPELSLMATENVSTTVFFSSKEIILGTKISVNFLDAWSNPVLCILDKFDMGFFSCCS